MNEHATVKPAPDVFAAVAAGMSEIKRIAKDSRNSEQKYDFASVDDFMAMVGPICAKNGLVTVMDETSVEPFEKPGKFGTTHWARFTYLVTTYHVSGSHLPPVTRRVEVIRNGPQAYGSAQSYALKQYYRQLFVIPTGDGDDPDFGGARAEREQSDATSRITSHVPQGGADPRDAEAALNALHGAATLADLQSTWTALGAEVRTNPLVAKAKDARKAELSQPVRKIEPDLIPY